MGDGCAVQLGIYLAIFFAIIAAILAAIAATATVGAIYGLFKGLLCYFVSLKRTYGADPYYEATTGMKALAWGAVVLLLLLFIVPVALLY